MVEAYDNVVTTPHFPKPMGWPLYGSAGAIARRHYEALNRLRGPFNINAAAMSAGLAALDDQAHIANSRAHNMQWRDWLVRKLAGWAFPCATHKPISFCNLPMPKKRQCRCCFMRQWNHSTRADRLWLAAYAAFERRHANRQSRCFGRIGKGQNGDAK